MYRAVIFQNSQDVNGEVLHEPKNFGNKVITGDIDLLFNGVNTAEFTIAYNNTLYRKIEPIKSLIKVIDTNTNKVIFDGRVAKIEGNFSGSHTQKIYCEDCLAYLHDSTQVYRKVQNTSIYNFFKMMIDEHNRQVEDWKKFKVGNVTVTNTTDNVYRYTSDTADTFETIKDKLINRLGGYIIWRRDRNNDLVIDYLQEYGEHIDTPIALGQNLKSAKRDFDVKELITRLVPVGAVIEQPNSSEQGADAAQPHITIEDVNGGRRYLRDYELEQRFGIIQKSVEWQDVKIKDILKSKGQDYLKNQRVGLLTWTVDVIDISLLDKSYQSFELGNYYMIRDEFLSVIENLQVVEKKIDITEPHKMSLKIGTQNKTLSQYQLEYQAAMTFIENQRKNSLQTISEMKDRIKELDAIAHKIPDQEKEINDLKQRIKELEANNVTYYDGVIPDISEFQGNINWDRVLANGLALAIVRVQYGANREDLTYKTNVSSLSRLSANFSVYSYLTASNNTEAELEAQRLYERTKSALGNGKQPRFYMIDVEEQTGANMRDIVDAYMNKLNKLGVEDKRIVLYIANHLYTQFNLNVSRAGGVVIPAYRDTPPDHDYDLWQYTDSGQIDGIDGKVDLNKNYSSKFKEAYLRKER
ncbi:phage tail spike protein [Leuconostoc citreum]|uniref:phage tail spike protein n=1 Tax=Leuconostoc citreum TaxID=33964 RepID=UPI0032DEB339